MRHFAVTFLRENPPIRKRSLLEGRFSHSFRAKSVKSQALLLRENSSLSALTGKLARQVLEVRSPKSALFGGVLFTSKGLAVKKDMLQYFFVVFKI